MENIEQVNSEQAVESAESGGTVKENAEIQSVEDGREEETSYGKFRNSEALLQAYNSLEAEFTKRSQRLKELENTAAKDKAEAPAEPVYLSEDWQRQVNEFVKNNPLAERFSEEIADQILNDDALARDKHCLERALNRVLAGKYRLPEELIGDEDFLNSHIFPNERITERIISDYLEKVSQINPPDMIIKKGEISLSPLSRPKTLAEAGEMAKKIFIRR